jgi:hypothetical protein
VAWRGRAFGLSIEAEQPIPGLAADTGDSSRRTRWEQAARADLDAEWAPRHGRQLVDMRHPGGELFLRVDHDPELGYRAEAPGYGIHRVSADGSRVQSVVPNGGARDWQRLFFAQVLPLAAATSGLDLLHAGAVAFGKSVFGFVAPSGTGKTSVVMQLLLAGADFVTDDVLALEVVDDSVKAHLGAAAISIDAGDLDEALRLQAWAEIDGKVQVDLAATSAATKLAGLFFLYRSTTSRLTIRSAVEGLGQKILGAAFLPYVKSRARLSTHLEVAAAIARNVPTYSVAIPAGMAARETAAGIRAQGAEEGLWAA